MTNRYSVIYKNKDRISDDDLILEQAQQLVKEHFNFVDYVTVYQVDKDGQYLQHIAPFVWTYNKDMGDDLEAFLEVGKEHEIDTTYTIVTTDCRKDRKHTDYKDTIDFVRNNTDIVMCVLEEITEKINGVILKDHQLTHNNFEIDGGKNTKELTRLYNINM